MSKKGLAIIGWLTGKEEWDRGKEGKRNMKWIRRERTREAIRIESVRKDRDRKDD